jgi:tetratricopeptide (TPR) repeat protein
MNSSRIEELKKFLSEDPSDKFSSYALALEYAELGINDEAVSLLERLIKADENYLAAYYQLGKLFELRKDFIKASSAYMKGLEIARIQNNQRTLNELKSALDMLDA